MPTHSLDYFHPVVRAWFEEAYREPSPPQAQGWPLIAQGKSVLVLAPTGSGKTLAAFLQCISSLLTEMENDDSPGVRVVYISPLKALNNDISRNLRIPLDGIRRKAEEMGITLPEIRVAVRTGDTPAKERQAMLKHPPHILITTPESLSLMLSSKARQIFGSTRFLIVDEIHNLFPTKRGVHLALAVEYLEFLAGRPLQRIGLSATQRPMEAVAAYLGGGTVDGTSGQWSPRSVDIVDTGQRKQLDLAIELPVDDFTGLPEKTIWPAIYRRLLELVEQHRSTLVFVNNRAVAERVTTNLNELAGSDLARVHHGSVSRELRFEVEMLLKTGQLPCLVATSSLELGIDIGAIDLVVQIESPHEVARGLQRVGRAGHIVGMPSKGRIIPKTRGDLLEAAFIVREMKDARIEPTHAPENCLDILAQQVAAMAIDREWNEDELFQLLRRAWSYRSLSRGDYERTLGMLAGRYAEEFTNLKPRIYWDQTHHTLITTDSGKRLIYTSGGTIPDRGYYGVYMAGSPVRLGELDEEFVHERRIGDRFVLGTSTWQVEEIRQDRVIVRPTGRSGVTTVPFWHGDGFGRPYDLGKRLGSFLHEASRHLDDPEGAAWLEAECQAGTAGGQVIRDYLLAQRESTGAIPSDRLLVIEEFRDELGEWRVLLHSPFGQRVNAPLGMLITAVLRDQGLELETIQNDDGILWIAPATDRPATIDPTMIDPTDLEPRLAEMISTTPLFGMLFRQSAARSLLLPRGGYGKKRTPLWLSRLKAADLLQVVGRYPSFPMVMESYREALKDVFDLDGLRELLSGLRSGAIRVHRVQHDTPSPFAQALLFSFTAFYMYQPDLPKAERRLHAFNLDRSQLRDLLGQAALRDLLDEQAITDTVSRARWLTAELRPSSADQLHAWLLRIGELHRDDPLWEDPPIGSWLRLLQSSGRALERQVGGQPIWIPAEYAGEFDLGMAGSINDSEVAVARRKMVLRYARSHGPFTATTLAQVYGWPRDEVERLLGGLESDGFLEHGEFLPQGLGIEWCDRELLRQIHRRSLAKARHEVEPRSAEDYACFLARWQGVGGLQTGSEALLAALQPLMGLYLPAKLWEEYILPSRIADYKPVLLDQLVGGGLLQWLAWGSGDAMRLALFNPGEAQPLNPSVAQTTSPAQEPILATLRKRGALFLPQLWSASGLGPNETFAELLALISLGLVSNDTFGPIRLLLSHGPNPKRGWNVNPSMLSRLGRWGAVSQPQNAPEVEPLMMRLFQRHGILSREVITREGLAWSEVSGILERWEMIGKAKRGYFVTGLSGVQYADGRAVDNLRLGVETGLPEFLVLACQDPANPWGQQLPWPETATVRLISPNLVVLQRGRPVMTVMGEKQLRIVTFGELSAEQLQGALGEMMAFLAKTPAGKRKLTVTEYNGQPIRETEAAGLLESLGFKPDYTAMTRWGR